MRLVRRLLVAGLVVVVLTAAGAGWALTRRPEPGPPTAVTLAGGMSTAQIASQLRGAGVISSELGFRVMARVRGVDGRIQAGRYELFEDMGVMAALDLLTRGARDATTAVTIPEGYTVRQTAARIAARTHIGEQDVLDAAASSEIRSSLQPGGAKGLEGFLLPETYAVSEHETGRGIVARMVQAFDDVAASLDWSAATSRGLTRYDAVIIASLVEREAKVDEDRAKVAAVVYNRLARGMKLQIDATVLYDLPRHKVPTRKDLQRDTPYNTYLHAGLPPTPIANPGLAALRAALDPAPIDALYYVVVDPSGRHGFTADYDEFLRLLKRRPAEVRGGTSGGSG